eukprot:2958187-Prymnesium_polylepis.1
MSPRTSACPPAMRRRCSRRCFGSPSRCGGHRLGCTLIPSVLQRPVRRSSVRLRPQPCRHGGRHGRRPQYQRIVLADQELVGSQGWGEDGYMRLKM